MNKPVLIRAGIAIGVLALVTGAAFAGNQFLSRVSPESKRAGLPEGFKGHTDKVAGFTIAYPQKWDRLQHEDPPESVPLVAGPAGANDLLLVRVCSLAAPIPASAVPDLEPGIKALVNKTNPKIVQERRVTLGGVPGFHYLYTFTDQATLAEAVHSHYFLIDGATLIQVVLQALPTEDFAELAPTFDQIAKSFKKVTRVGRSPSCIAGP